MRQTVIGNGMPCVKPLAVQNESGAENVQKCIAMYVGPAFEEIELPFARSP